MMWFVGLLRIIAIGKSGVAGEDGRSGVLPAALLLVRAMPGRKVRTPSGRGGG